ncbi:MAG TPA: hypothetical protein VGM07_21260 [Stellaceae bacterium]|jgi:hypothetical protein
MAETSRGPGPAEQGIWSWLAFWLQFAILALCVALGAFAASADELPGDYGCGIALIIGALALAFVRLKQSFDGASPDWRDFVFVGGMASLAVAIPVFTVIGLVGLFIAHDWPVGALHAAGLGLFVVSAVIIFLDIKTVFDRIDSQNRN